MGKVANVADVSVIGTKRGAKKGKKSRKVGRNYRWDYISHSTTKYRSRHNIGQGYRRDIKNRG